MRRLGRRSRNAVLAALLAAAAGPAAAEDASSAGDAVPVRWEAQQIELTLFFFTNYYTCDGLRSQLEKLMRAMGARADVTMGGLCTNVPGQARLWRQVDTHRIKIAFAVPVVAEGGAVPGETFEGRWQEVEIEPNEPRSIKSGDCELVEQFGKKILPLFNPKEISRLPNCNTRGQQFVGEPVLRAVVLIPELPAEKTPPAPAQPAEPGEPAEPAESSR